MGENQNKTVKNEFFNVQSPAIDTIFKLFINILRSLSQVTRITSKKKCPEFITFRYSDDAKDCFYISEAGDATREIKRQVVAVLEALGVGKGES